MTRPQLASPCSVPRDEAFGAFVTLMAAYALDPVARWIWPHPSTFADAFPTLARALGGRAFDHDTADGMDPLLGVALWLPAGVPPDDGTIDDVVQTTVLARRRADVLALLAEIRRVRPARPHAYLPLIGVLPGFQGRGIGTLLLRRGLARWDRDGVPTYVEASSPASRALFERHDFEVVGEVYVGISPPLWPMLRRPGGRAR